jgi:hypothetical protein
MKPEDGEACSKDKFVQADASREREWRGQFPPSSPKTNSYLGANQANCGRTLSTKRTSEARLFSWMYSARCRPMIDKVLPQLAWLAPEFEEACSKDKFVQADASRERECEVSTDEA